MNGARRSKPVKQWNRRSAYFSRPGKGFASGAAPRSRPYRLKGISLEGPVPGVNLDEALQLAELLEDEGIRSKLELRK